MTDRAPIGVVGLWHLGCSITAAWLTLGRQVSAVDFEPTLMAGLKNGQPPLYEPRLAETLTEGIRSGALVVSENPDVLSDAPVVFIAYDTPVDHNDESDITLIETAIDRIIGVVMQDAIIVISAQLPIGTSRRLRARVQRERPDVEIAYSPENLRLGESIKCYLEPGHIVVGAETPAVHQRLLALFEPMGAQLYPMNLPGSEMVKHCINSFLATSVTMANQWSDIADSSGAEFNVVANALRADPRIGQRAYITPGIGFSGGTLGRDLRVLEGVNTRDLQGNAPLFGQVWRYNAERAVLVADRIASLVKEGESVALLGMTYKPGTSTLRRSLPLTIAGLLRERGVSIRAHDPKADWTTVDLPDGLTIAPDPYAAARDASLVVLLTEWPEYRDIDFTRLAGEMRHARLLDPKHFLDAMTPALRKAGLAAVPLVPARGDTA